MATIQISGRTFALVDLPGCYSLQGSSKDEKITIDYLLGKLQKNEKALSNPDLIFFILDATNLKRNLYLLSQTIQLKIPIVVVLTMTDIIKKNKIAFDADALSKQLGLKVVSVVGKQPDTMENLKNELSKGELPLEPNRQVFEKLMNEYLKLNSHIKKISKAMMPQIHYQWANKILEACGGQKQKLQKPWVRTFDAFLTGRYSGLFVFTGVMYCMFQLIYRWSEPVMGLIENFFAYLSQSLSHFSWLLNHPILYSLVADGILQGVGSVIVFLPQVIFLFLFIAILEDSGYITRAVFLMDKIFSWGGLSGRSFVPMLSSFACAVPGILSARVIADQKIRLATILVSPLMSCSARLPIYILMIGTFIEPTYGSSWAAFTLFLMHAIGPMLSLPISRLVTRNYQKSPKPVFFMEMPPYRLPYLKNIFYQGYHAGNKFLSKAGGVILVFSMIIWALSYFPKDENITQEVHQKYEKSIKILKERQAKKEVSQMLLKREQELSARHLEKSYLGTLGKTIQPFFAPLGFDWKITIGLLSAFPAREVIISSLGILYNIRDESSEKTSGLREKLASARNSDGQPTYTPLFSISLMIFFAFCCQCMSTLAVMYRELNSWVWPVVTFFYMTSLAYLSSLFVYQIGSLFL